MKLLYVAFAAPLLSACVSIELPGLMSDTAKVAKDAYHAVAGSKSEQAVSPAETETSDTVSNTYIGQDSQTPAEVKKLCVNEASSKLFKARGKEVPYTVIENTITTINNAIAATCKIVAAKPEQAPVAKR